MQDTLAGCHAFVFTAPYNPTLDLTLFELPPRLLPVLGLPCALPVYHSCSPQHDGMVTLTFVPSSNASPEQRQRFIRSARKLEQVLGTSAFLTDSTGVHLPQHPLHSAPRRHNHNPDASSMNATENAAPARRLRPRVHHTHRQGSIFDLTEEQILALGIESSDRMRPHAPPKLFTDDLPRPSLDSVVSASTKSDASSMFVSAISNSASSSCTSIDVIMEDRPPSPVLDRHVDPAPVDNVKSSKRRRLDSRSLFLTVESNLAVVQDRRASQGPLTPRTAPLNYSPSAPLTPTTPSAEDLAQLQRRKLHKILRTLGENVPADLVFPSVGRKKSRRASIAAASDTASVLSYSSPIEFEHYGFGWDDCEMPLAPPAPEHLRSARRRGASITRGAAPVQLKADVAPGRVIPDTHLPELAVSLETSRPVFTSGPRQPEAERWVGSWNRPDIHTVQSELRALRWR
jgi:hypothetical protein